MAYREIDPEAIAQAVALYEQGMTSREVVAELAARGIEVDATTVTRHAEPRRRGPRGRDDIDEWRLLDLHFAGSTPTEIGREMHLPRTTVRQRLSLLLGKPRPGAAELPQYRQPIS